jgi:hypothetical protein
MFALQSCRGFSPNTYHMWCCTKNQCNIHYTEKAVQDLGFTLPFALEHLTCHELQPSTKKSSGQAASASSRTKLLVLLLASGLAAAATLVLVLLWWHIKSGKGNTTDADELQKERSIHEHQMIRESSQNGQEVVESPHRSNQMDLRAQTENVITVSDERLSNGKTFPKKLMVRVIQIFGSVI